MKLVHRRITFFAAAAFAVALPLAGAGAANADVAADHKRAAEEACAAAGYEYNSNVATSGFRPASVECVNRSTFGMVFVPVADGTPCTILDGFVTREGRAQGGICV